VLIKFNVRCTTRIARPQLGFFRNLSGNC